MERYSDLSRAELPVVTPQLAKSDFHAVAVKRKRWAVPILERREYRRLGLGESLGTPKGITLSCSLPARYVIIPWRNVLQSLLNVPGGTIQRGW